MFSFVNALPLPTPSPTPTPSPYPSPSPTSSSSPSQTPTCSGEASIEFSALRYKSFSEEVDETAISNNIKSAVKEMLKKMNDNEQQVIDFKACKYPSTFSCSPIPPCKVILGYNFISTLSPDTAIVAYGKSCSKTGTITKTIFLITTIDKVLDSIMPDVMKELQKLADEQFCPCPSDYGRTISIIMTNNEVIYNYILGIPVSVTVKIDYLIKADCVME